MRRVESIKNMTVVRLFIYAVINVILLGLFISHLRMFYLPEKLPVEGAKISDSYSLTLTGSADPVYDEEYDIYHVLGKTNDNMLVDITTVSESDFNRFRKASSERPVRLSGEAQIANQKYMESVSKLYPGFTTSSVLIKQYTFRDRGHTWVFLLASLFFTILSVIIYRKTDNFNTMAYADQLISTQNPCFTLKDKNHHSENR